MQNGDGLGRREGEELNLAMSSDGICGELDRLVNVVCDFQKMGINASGDLGEEDVNIACSRKIGGEKLDLVEISNGIFCDLGGEDGGVECGSNSDECFRFEKKRDGHHADFERPGSAANQIVNSVVNVVNGGGHHRSETGVTYKVVNGDLPHPLVENASEFDMAAIRNCNGISKESVEVGAAIGHGCTVKNMDKCSIAYTEKELRIDIERGVKPKIRWLSRGPLGQAAVSNGFVITKIQNKKSKLTGEVSEFEEFSITVPPQSALLFPCQRAISIDASDCQVQHLIVLDGTWAKAQRMYHENPWLQLLPHVKLESDRVSLYSEVRHEPRVGCLSTIESIVVAMRKLGEDAKGLDDLLDVFESMIADQRRCKDENWKQKLKSQS